MIGIKAIWKQIVVGFLGTDRERIAKKIKKLRAIGYDQITINSITTCGGETTGCSYGYNDDIYSGLSVFGHTKDEIHKQAEEIYMKKYLEEHGFETEEDITL